MYLPLIYSECVNALPVWKVHGSSYELHSYKMTAYFERCFEAVKNVILILEKASFDPGCRQLAS